MRDLKSGRIAAARGRAHSVPQLRHGLDMYPRDDVLITIEFNCFREDRAGVSYEKHFRLRRYEAGLVFTDAPEATETRDARSLLFIRK